MSGLIAWFMHLINRNKEVWHYTCENAHKWKSYNSPGGGYYAPKTRCPVCNSEVCMGNVYINGKQTKMGAIHMDFGKKRKNEKTN